MGENTTQMVDFKDWQCFLVPVRHRPALQTSRDILHVAMCWSIWIHKIGFCIPASGKGAPNPLLFLLQSSTQIPSSIPRGTGKRR